MLKYSNPGYSVLSDVCGTFSLPNGELGKNVIIFIDGYISSSASVDNKVNN